MVDKKQQFDGDHEDDFDIFGESDDFSFDDDEQTFQFDDDASIDSETNANSDKPDYEFNSEEAIMDESAISQSNGNFFNTFIEQLKTGDSKRIMIYAIAGIVGVILVFGMILKMLFASEPKTQTTRTTTLQQPLSSDFSTDNETVATENTSASIPEYPQAVPVATPQVIQAVTLPGQNTLVNNASDAQTQTNAEYQKHINMLEAQIAQLNAQLASNTQLNASNQEQIANLIKSVSSMQDQVARVNKAMQALVAGVNAASESGTTTIQNSVTTLRRSSDYYVQAIIPGRAWLKNAAGQVITVAVGDAVPGYGTAVNIDSQNGIVTTSTGTKLVFGIEVGAQQ